MLERPLPILPDNAGPFITEPRKTPLHQKPFAQVILVLDLEPAQIAPHIEPFAQLSWGVSLNLDFS